jgi:hypothetical protein
MGYAAVALLAATGAINTLLLVGPGACVSATIWRFTASEYCRRFVAPGCFLVSTKPVVDTSFCLIRHPLFIAPIAPQRQALLTERLLTKSAPLDSISPPISRFDTRSA